MGGWGQPTAPRLSGARRLLPNQEGPCSEPPIGCYPHEMAAVAKKIVPLKSYYIIS